MKASFACAVCVILAVELSLAQNSVSVKWKAFKSTAGFSVKYPESWYRKGISKDSLLILSSKGGAEALIIKHGQAMISAMQAEGHAGISVSQIIRFYSQNADIISRQRIQNRNAGRTGCSDLEEIVSKEGAVPPEDIPGTVPYIINTEFFCQINQRTYVTVLRNFQGDRRQVAYQQVALRMAKSIRTYK